MNSSYEAQSITVDQLLHRAREGRIRIPNLRACSSRGMALQLFGSRDPQRVTPDAFRRLAEFCGEPGEEAVQIVREVTARLVESRAAVLGESALPSSLQDALRAYQDPLLGRLG